MIIKTDIDGKIKYITAAQKEMLGHGSDNAIEKCIFDFVYQGDKKTVLRKIRKDKTSKSSNRI